ncbi:MAG: cob(I)yrinic acid a,c-diamide adenosyltransferase [Patescibacteria group bacterium]
MKYKVIDRGLVHVYTGDGKGKTTAALGLAVRAISYRKRVLIVQFIKGPWRSGELNIIQRLRPYLTIHAMGEGFVKILGDRKPLSVHRKAAQGALRFAQRAMRSGRYDIVVLDEVNVAVRERLLAVSQVAELVRKKPRELELVLTGRNAAATIERLADYVSHIREIRHPYRRGILARQSIDY